MEAVGGYSGWNCDGWVSNGEWIGMSWIDSLNKFFESYPQERAKGLGFWAFMIPLLYLSAAGIMSVFRNNPDAVFASQMYLYMLLVVGMIGALDIVSKRNLFFKSYTPTITWKSGIKAMVIGAIISYILLTNSYSIGIPANLQQLSGQQTFLFVVLFAGIVEEGFFRATLFPTMAAGLKQTKLVGKWYWIISLIIINIFFGYFHYYIWGANTLAIYSAIFIGVLYCVGNAFMKDSMFSIGAHMSNNYLLWVAAGGMLG